MTTCNPSLVAYRRLACAILVRAARDARSGNGCASEARDWLAGEGADLAEQLDIAPSRVAAWVDDLRTLAQPALPGL